MNRRPKPGEDEEDLLAYQDDFLKSGSSPSAKLIRPGEKRTLKDGRQTAGRDIVSLNPGTAHPSASVGARHASGTKPPVKKSKFKQQKSAQRLQSQVPRITCIQECTRGTEDMGDLMDRQDKHITKILSEVRVRTSVLSEVRERDTVTPIQAVSMSYARLGFPSIQEVDLQQKDAVGEENSGVQVAGQGSGKKKKSLFAKQLGEMPLSMFGMVDGREQGAEVENSEKQAHRFPAAGPEQLLISPSVISGEGLMGLGVSEDQVSADLRRIQEENLKTLSAMPEAERQQEKKTLLQNLSPDLVAFLKRRREGEVKVVVEKEEAAMEEDVSHGGEPHEGREPEGACCDTLPSEVKDMEGSWLHMDVTESEKLEWMTDVPVTSQDDGESEARFSFDGLLLPKSIDLPSTLGLHHHGDSPASAGYTLQELLHLTRSSVLQQRVLSITTLAKIMERNQRNEFAGVLDHSPTRSLIDAGLPLVLRYSLDEGSLAMMSAAVQATHSLLVVDNEEIMLDSLSMCSCGTVLPSLETAKDHKEEQAEEDDATVLREDVVKGFLQVKLLPRLRYILEMMAPPPPVVDMILRILTQVSRHSLQSANEVFRCPRLLDTVFTVCLDSSEPCPGAVKLMVAIARAGRNLASQIVQKYKVMNTVIKNVAILPQSRCAHELYIHSCCLWRVLLSYGLGADVLRDTYSTLLGHLVSSFAQPLSDLTTEGADCMCALLDVLEGGLHVAAVKAQDLEIQGSQDVLQAPALDWSYARGVLQPIMTFVCTMMTQFPSTPQEHQMLLLSHLLNVLASYAAHLPDMLLHNQSMVDVLQMFDGWFSHSGCITAVVESGVLLKALRALSQVPEASTAGRDSVPSLRRFDSPLTPAKLGVYGQALMEQSDWREMLQKRTQRLFAADLALSTFRLLDIVTSSHKGLIKKVSPLLKDATVLSYLQTFHCLQREHFQSVFSAVETTAAVHLVQMFTSLIISHPGALLGEVIGTYHQTCLGLLSLLPAGSEAALLHLLERSVFPPAMFWELGSGGDMCMSERDLESLTLHESPQMVTGEKDKTTREVLSEAFHSLPQIQAELISALKRNCLSSKVLQCSRDRQNHKVLRVETLLLPSSCGSLLPSDWPMLPLLDHYNAAVEGLGHLHSDAMPASLQTATSVRHSVQFWLLLEHLRPASMADCSVTAKFARLACVFLTASDLFLDPTIHSCLAALLKTLTAPNNLSKLDFAAQVPGVSSFYDLHSAAAFTIYSYMALVSQFSAVSYGDTLFASVILLPLQQCCPVELRRLVWDEQAHVLRALSLPLEQLPVPINNFLYPVERDESVLSLYRRALLSGAVRPSWSPVMHKIATHHLQHRDRDM